jgi:hypothetical protein
MILITIQLLHGFRTQDAALTQGLGCPTSLSLSPPAEKAPSCGAARCSQLRNWNDGMFHHILHVVVCYNGCIVIGKPMANVAGTDMTYYV